MKFPNPITAAKALARHLKAIWAARSLKANNVTDEVYIQRLTACATSGPDGSQCPHNLNNQCQLCTCFLHLKARLKTETCPDNRWPL